MSGFLSLKEGIMNALDIVIIVVFSISFFIGVKSGLLAMLISFAAVLISFWTASAFYEELLQILGISYKNQGIAEIVSYVLIFIAVLFLLGFLAKLLTKAMDFTPVGALNRIFGGLIAMFFAIMVFGIFGNFAIDNDELNKSQNIINESKLLLVSKDITSFVYNYSLGLLKDSDLFDKDEGFDFKKTGEKLGEKGKEILEDAKEGLKKAEKKAEETSKEIKEKVSDN